MNGHEASLPIRGQRQAATAQTKEVPQAIAKDLNKVTGLHFSKGTWGVIWTVVLGAAGWLTNMKFDSMATATKLDGLADKMNAVVESNARLGNTVDKLDGKLERFGERLTRVEIEAGTHAKD